jgi:hypothetical protein
MPSNGLSVRNLGRRVELSDADNVAITKPNRKWRAAYTTSLTTIAKGEELDN